MCQTWATIEHFSLTRTNRISIPEFKIYKRKNIKYKNNKNKKYIKANTMILLLVYVSAEFKNTFPINI